MFNLLKSDILKLKWSKSWFISLLSVIVLFVIYMLAGDASFVYSGSHDLNGVDLLGQGIGFVSNMYKDVDNPLAGEIIRTALSYTAFIWLVILIFSSSFFTKEYSENTIKLAVAYGENRFKLFLSKFIIISLYSFILYYLFTFFIFIHASVTMKFTPNISDVFMLFKLTTLNFLVMEIFILIILIISMIIKNIGAVNGIMCFYIITCPLVYMTIWFNMDAQSLLMKAYIKTNPMYYWSTICAYNLNNNIINETIIYFIIAIIVGAFISYSLLKNQEIK